MAGFGPGGRAALRPLRAAQRLPARHRRQHRRDRGVLRAVLPRAAAAGLGRHRRPAAWSCCSCRASGGGRSARLAVVIALLVLESVAPQQHWSPYYKLSVQPDQREAPGAQRVREQHPVPGGPVADARCTHRSRSTSTRTSTSPRSSLKNVLIIGPGTGNDAAVALSEGAKHVDAVEIDPVLPQIGREHHPDHPYQNPRVTLHIADGREYLQNTSKKYNLILFALPDSLTALAGQSSLRLESYLLTEQSIAAGPAAPGAGRHVLDVQLLRSRSCWTGTPPRSAGVRARALRRRSGRRWAAAGWPCSPSRSRARCRTASDLQHGAKVAPATDDHPFPYLPNKSIPASTCGCWG